MSDNYAPIPQNYRKNVDWILKAYSDAGVSFPNGFQKDAIQNAAGARKTRKWKNWTCDISIIKTTKGTFVVVEDSGTVGLTGRNMSTSEINAYAMRDEQLPSHERLARFSSMFNSGGNTTGGGLYGAGKSVYSVASTTYTYYFDSLREDGLYIANANKNGQILIHAHENEEAKSFILRETGLSEKKTVGTRIIIENPREDLIDSIENGEIISLIQESWWLIIKRLDNNSCISINRIPVEIPANLTAAKNIFDLPKPEEYAVGYKVKNFGLYVFEDNSPPWQGISYYRKGMKIGDIEINDIPKKLVDKFWGYVEVDEAWESELAEIEDNVHFGVSKGQKRKNAYQYIKNYCNVKFKRLLTEWGYIKDRENEDKKLREELQQIAEDIQDLFDKLGFEDLGKGPQKADFDVRWQDIKFPIANSTKVTTGDNISFSVRIKSSYIVDRKFEYVINVINPQTKEVIHEIFKDKVTIKSGETYKEDFIHKVLPENSIRYKENRIALSVKVVGSGKEKSKELHYFYDIDKPENTKEDVKLTLHDCEFPIEGSRRVNFGQAIKNVCYRIDNKRNCTLKFKLNVSIHNASDITLPKIVDIASVSGEIPPYEEYVTEYFDDIIFNEDIYASYLSSGTLELRARLLAADDDIDYEKGDRITFYNFKIFLNCDEKHGKNDAFNIKSIEAPDNFKRSWYEPGADRTIFLNVGHAAYLGTKDYPEIQHDYMREQMLKQYVMLYLAEGKYHMFGPNGKDFAELEPQDAADVVINKIEQIYYESLK